MVGAAQAYGDNALQVATTLKLARALWIIPLALVSAMVYQRMTKTGGKRRITVPWFIAGYIAAMLLATILPQLDALYSVTFNLGKQLLVFCLYLVGASITLERLKAAGWRPLLLAIVLWVVIATMSLLWLTVPTG